MDNYENPHNIIKAQKFEEEEKVQDTLDSTKGNEHIKVISAQFENIDSDLKDFN